ncbi:MAG TPA: ERAP1-like C-terminal domain-containing protein, partial [Acidimicrobiales bacterium]|nr:ERAP1-like C-terminal domain-containing protein [Acidimicrobiales bacterium]
HKGDGDGGGVALVELGRERVQVRADSTGAPLRWQPRRGGNRWLVVPNANGRAYVKAVLDATSMAVALERLGALADPVARAVCSGALWDAVADGTLEPTRFVAAVIRHLRSELVAGVVEQLVERAVKAATLLSADPCAGPAVTALAGAARNWLEAAEPGADLQLVSVRLLCTVARSPEDLDLLERLLSRPGFVRGLEVDTELRWQLLVALAAAGCIATEDISLAEARDGTEHARRQAWAARAALPDPAMKASSLAWIASTAGSLAERRAAMEGWQQPHQRALLAPFAVQYPETAVSVWSQGEEAGIAFARAMYPHHTPDDGVVLAATASLDHEGVPGGLRRVVQEERARLARYQLARRRDASCCEPITPG